MNRQSDVLAISFKGNLEISTPTATEYNKEEFGMALKEQVSYVGLNSLFSISDSSGMVFDLTESSTKMLGLFHLSCCLILYLLT